MFVPIDSVFPRCAFEVAPIPDVVDGGFDGDDESAGSSLDELARGGAQQVSGSAIPAEVGADIDEHSGEVDEPGHRPDGPERVPRAAVDPHGDQCGSGPRTEDERRADPPRDRGTQEVLVGDPTGVDTQAPGVAKVVLSYRPHELLASTIIQLTTEWQDEAAVTHSPSVASSTMLDAPNFAALYDVDDELTPRMAARLWISAGSAADSFGDGWGEVWMSRLPRVGQLYRDDAFDAAFAERYAILETRLGTAQWSPCGLLSCTADEIAFDLVIDYAEDNDGWYESYDWFAALPQCPEDHDFRNVREQIYEDYDYELLYNPALDGIEDPDAEEFESLHFAYLHPRDWFKTFRE